MNSINYFRASLIGIIILLPFLAGASGNKKIKPTDTTANSNQQKIYYRVQILALQHPINLESIQVNGVDGKVYTSRGPDITRYFMGEFRDLKSADSLREKLAKKGFQDACIVAYKGNNRITIKQSLALLGGSK